MAQITVQQFRTNFPEFASPSRFPTGLIQFWLDWAYQFLPSGRWGRQLDLGAQLFAAHNVAIERRAMDEGVIVADAQTGTVGLAFGPMSAKSVDKVSVSYDTQASVSPDAGHWNLTIYGQRMWTLIQMFGAGPVQFGTAPVGPWIVWFAGVPIWWPGWFGQVTQ